MQGLAVHRDHRAVPLRLRGHRRRAGAEPPGGDDAERAGVEAGQQPLDGAAGWYPTGEPEPVLSVFVQVVQPVRDRSEGRRPRQNGAQTATTSNAVSG